MNIRLYNIISLKMQSNNNILQKKFNFLVLNINNLERICQTNMLSSKNVDCYILSLD